MLCADMVEVSWKQGGRNRHTMALLEDISPSGACLQLEAAVPMDTEIRWRSPKHEFSGRVRYCVYREIGYFIGVEFPRTSRWSKSAYRPRHLLDLKRLVTR